MGCRDGFRNPILETVGPYATVVLAEGQYTVVIATGSFKAA